MGLIDNLVSKQKEQQAVQQVKLAENLITSARQQQQQIQRPVYPVQDSLAYAVNRDYNQPYLTGPLVTAPNQQQTGYYYG
jgi:hypothetical protein